VIGYQKIANRSSKLVAQISTTRNSSGDETENVDFLYWKVTTAQISWFGLRVGGHLALSLLSSN